MKCDAPSCNSAQTKIVFLTRTDCFGGAEKHLLQLIAALGKSAESIIVCLGADHYSGHLDSVGKQDVMILTNPAIDGFSLCHQLLRQMAPDRVVFVNGVSRQFPLSFYLAARLVTSCVNAIYHQGPLETAHRLDYLKRKMTGWIADKNICVSQAVKSALIREYGFPKSRTIVVSNGVNVSEYQVVFHQREVRLGRMGIPMILCVARLSPEKNIKVLLEALSIVRRASIQFHCFIVGDGPEREKLVSETHKLKLVDAVSFAGFQQHIVPYLRDADLFVLPSLYEGLPLALLEAMASGLPCIATNVAGNSEVISHEENGLLVEPNSPDSLARAIMFLLEDGGTRNILGQNARRRVVEGFDVAKSSNRLAGILLGEVLSS